MREVIEHLRCIGVDGCEEAADALDLLEKLRAHPGTKTFESWLRSFGFENVRRRKVQEMVLQLLKGGRR